MVGVKFDKKSARAIKLTFLNLDKNDLEKEVLVDVVIDDDYMTAHNCFPDIKANYEPRAELRKTSDLRAFINKMRKVYIEHFNKQVEV